MSLLPGIAMLFAVLFALAPAATPRQLLEIGDSAKLMARLHEKWMAQYGRSYKDEAEKAARLQVFRGNVELIESFNSKALAGGKKYRLSVNQFADLTHDEFHDMTNNRLAQLGSAGSPPAGLVASSFMYENVTDVPDSVDWRSRGAVSGVKSQGSCGCCWAFAAVATMESLIQIQTGNIVSLSEQQLMDCTNGDGCAGGNAALAFAYIKNNGGLASEADYPYREVDTNACSAENTVSLSSITSFESVPANDESALLAAVTAQPVYASIQIGSPEFRFYSEGIFDGDCSVPTPSNHAVAVIGYGTEGDGNKYWLVKNSWGTTWGEGGFGKIARESTNGGAEGVCSIARRTSYPVK